MNIILLWFAFILFGIGCFILGANHQKQKTIHLALNIMDFLTVDTTDTYEFKKGAYWALECMEEIV